MPDPTYSEHHAQWLSMIRLQVLTARQQSAAPAPLSSLALNTMQDAAESMLLLVSNKLGLSIGRQVEFDSILGTVVAAVDDDDVRGYVAGLRTMNRARVNFKHGGNRADDSTVRQHMDTVDAAMSQIARSVFGVELDRVSVLTLVSNAVVRRRLQVAQYLREQGQHGDALTDLAQAFHLLLREFESRKSRWSGSIYSTKPAHAPHIMRLDHQDPLRHVYEWFDAIDEQLRVISIGVDPQGYAFFRAHTPNLLHMMNGDWLGGFYTGTEAITDADWGRCVRFVVETSLRLDANDFEVGEPERGGGLSYTQYRRNESDDPVIPDVRSEITG